MHAATPLDDTDVTGARTAAASMAQIWPRQAEDDPTGRTSNLAAELAMALSQSAQECERRAADHEAGRLSLQYQPIFEARTGKLAAREALLRWQHPRLGAIPPAAIIPAAEASGQIAALGDWVLHEACREAATWFDEDARGPRAASTTRIAVNVSPLQLGRGGALPRTVRAALAASGLHPSRLEIEITESALLDGTAEVVAELQSLRGIGVSLALDDFGTGFSSLAHLCLVPFDRIKIDRSFVHRLREQPAAAAIIGAVARMARQMGIRSVAEGIETEDQLAFVTEQGCSELQGYLLGRPAAAACFSPEFRAPFSSHAAA